MQNDVDELKQHLISVWDGLELSVIDMMSHANATMCMFLPLEGIFSIYCDFRTHAPLSFSYSTIQLPIICDSHITYTVLARM